MRPTNWQTRAIIAIGFAVCLAAGCGQDKQVADQVELDLIIEVIGTYRNGDAEYVRGQIESLLPDGIRNRSWERGGNQCAYEIPAVADVDALAGQIQFGKVIHVNHLICGC